MNELLNFPIQLVCPNDGALLHQSGKEQLRCTHGHDFPIVDGIPVLLRGDVDQTIGLATASLDRARRGLPAADSRRPDLFLESVGVSEFEKALAVELAEGNWPIDPVAAVLISATNGIAYKHLIGNIQHYPIPEIRIPKSDGRTLLDVGCSWGRWSIAAARKGYRVVGIDPSLGALMAARRISRAMGLSIDFVCGDARYLPFARGSFESVFSYSVLQHFSKQDATVAFREISRITDDGGTTLIQMPNRYGLRSQMHLARRGYGDGSGFDVRYWTMSELLTLSSETIGPTDISVHCFFGLGLEPADLGVMRPTMRWVVRASETLRHLSEWITPLRAIADSLYLQSKKRPRTGV